MVLNLCRIRNNYIELRKMGKYYCGGRAIGTYNNDLKILFTHNCLPVGIVEILYALVAQQA